MGWFLYNSKTGLTLLILTTTFSIYIFSFHEEILIPFPQVSILTRHTFRKSINQECKWKMKQTIATNNFMFFWILIKLNFIPILICWKKILYFQSFSIQNPQPNLLMRPFTTHIHHLLIRVRAKLFVVIIFFNLFSFFNDFEHNHCYKLRFAYGTLNLIVPVMLCDSFSDFGYALKST